MSSHDATGESAQLCALCSEGAPSRCSSCHNIRYCSSECQRADWTVHKIVCKSFRKVLEAPEPSDAHVRAIYFPEQGSQPRFVWLRKINTAKTGELKIDISDLDISEQRKKDFGECNILKHSHVLDRAIPPLTWNWSFTTASNGMYVQGEFNSSVTAIDQELLSVISGPVVFHGCSRDLDTVDFRNVVDALRWLHYRQTHIAKPKNQYEFPTLHSVLVNCFGDMHICRQPSYAEFPLPAFTLKPGHGKLIDIGIGDLVGLPLQGVKAPVGLPYRGRVITSSNGVVIPANMNHNLPSLQPLCDLFHTGGIAVTRKDCKYLHVAHINALVRYSDSITDGRKQDVSLEDRAMMLEAKATAQGFKAFWEKLKSEGKFLGIESSYNI